MEAITYDRAEAFKAEVPPDEYKTWQPKKVMQVLAGIDPKIGRSSVVRIGRQDDLGTRAPEHRMKTMGTDNVLTLADIKKHYDAIGSFLHIPTSAQIEAGTAPDRARLQAHCSEIVDILERVRSSRIWNNTMGSFASVECFRCKDNIRRRLPVGTTSLEVRCFKCQAEYLVSESGPGQTYWEPKQEEVECPTPGCRIKFALWPDEIRPGQRLHCTTCGERYSIDFGLWKIEESAPAST